MELKNIAIFFAVTSEQSFFAAVPSFVKVLNNLLNW